MLTVKCKIGGREGKGREGITASMILREMGRDGGQIGGVGPVPYQFQVLLRW